MPPILKPAQDSSAPMTDRGAVIAGAVAGTLAPLSTWAIKRYEVTQASWSSGDKQIKKEPIPLDLIFIFALIGAIVVYFVAERVRRHVFVYGVAAPFVVLAVLGSKQVVSLETQNEEIETSRETVISAYNDEQDERQIGKYRQAEFITEPVNDAFRDNDQIIVGSNLEDFTILGR